MTGMFLRHRHFSGREAIVIEQRANDLLVLQRDNGHTSGTVRLSLSWAALTKNWVVTA
jgi:hypothetical protein